MAVAALSIAGLAFAAGNAAPKVKLKFPYAGAKLNQPCGKTEFEWRCATKGIRRDKPHKLSRYFDLVRLRAMPRKKGLLVRAEIVRRPGKTDYGDSSLVSMAVRDLERLMPDRFGFDRPSDGEPFWRGKDRRLELFVKGKLVAVQEDGHRVNPKN